MLTPLDAEGVKFRNALSGYDRNDVEQFRDRVIQALEEHIAQTENLRLRIANLEEQLVRYHDSEELLKNSVVLAQRTADELIAAAHQRADSIVQAAQLEGESVRRSLSDLRSQREQFEYAFYGLLTGFKQRLEQGNPALAPIPSPVHVAAEPRVAPPPQPSSAAGFSTERVRASSVPQPQQPAMASPISPQAPNMRDADVSSLSAALAAAQPAVETAPAPAQAPWLESPTLPLEETLTFNSQSGIQDARQAEEQTELREEIT
jgi:cell division initiation protein